MIDTLGVDAQRSFDACEEERLELFLRRQARADRLAACEVATQLGYAMHHVRRDNHGLAMEAVGMTTERLEESGRVAEAELLAEVSLQAGYQLVSQRALLDACITVTANCTP